MSQTAVDTLEEVRAASDENGEVALPEQVEQIKQVEEVEILPAGRNSPAPRFLRRMPAGQLRAGKLLIGFFCVMLLFTLVSRGLDSFSVAVVKTKEPQNGALTKKITVSGAVEPLTEFAVAVPEGFLVRQALVEEGSRVEEGDILAILDMDSIQNQLSEARRALERAQLNAAKGNIGKPEPVDRDIYEDVNLQQDRAEEDLENVRSAAEEKVERARADLAEIRFKRNGMYGDDVLETELEAVLKELEQAERAYEDAVRQAEQDIRQAERSVEDAEVAADKVTRERQEKERQEAHDDKSTGLDNRLSYLSVEEAQEKIARLQKLVETEGKIYSDVSGIITKTSIETGGITGSGGAFVVGETGEGCLFRGKADEESGKQLARGDKLEITLPGRADIATGVIDTIKPPKEKGGEYTVTVLLEGVEADPGTACTGELRKKVEETGSLLPASAVYSESGSKTLGYVYVVREKNTTMGTQAVAEKMAVDIVDRSGDSVLVRAPLASDDRVIVSSSRDIGAGDRVREEAAE